MQVLLLDNFVRLQSTKGHRRKWYLVFIARPFGGLKPGGGWMGGFLIFWTGWAGTKKWVRFGMGKVNTHRMGKEPPVLLKMRWAHINRSTHRNLAHTLHITLSLQDSFTGFTIDWILAPRKVRDFENALRRLPSGSPGFIWGLNLWIEPATKLPGDSLLRQPVDTEARIFFFCRIPPPKKKKSKTKNSLMSLQSGGSPVWWRSCPETTHPGGFISLCPFLPPTRCLDVLLWAGTLAESAVHLCKWPLQHPSHLFDLIATVELFGGVWIYRILLQKKCWWCIHIYIQGCHSYV